MASLTPAAGVVSVAEARGVTPYLPLNLSPEIERDVERVLILGDKAVSRRPIAAATVLQALPKACARDKNLCERVQSYLSAYMHNAGVTQLQAELAVASGKGDGSPIPNQHGLPIDSKWQVSAATYWQPSDYMMVNAGGVAYQGRVTPTGSYVSVGFDFAQLDIGFRDHWLSPLTDSSMLMSTEAPTMPSVTISNYEPISALGITYELFLAKMSTQSGIAYFDSTTSGHPHLAGMQLGVEPVSGYTLALNRLMQYGGGARGGSGLHDFYDALFANHAANHPDTSSQGLEFGNQQASVTSSLVFPGEVPFAVNMEYAGEDNAFAGQRYLGDTDLSLGIDFPKLWRDFDFTYEVSEWQNTWYVHHIYPDGMTNDGLVLGHWFGDQRQPGNAIGGLSQMLRFGWTRHSGEYLEATYRNLSYDSAWAGSAPQFQYRQLHELGVRYSSEWLGHPISAELFLGRDVFGHSFARLAGSFDIAAKRGAYSSAVDEREGDASGTQVFADVGINYSRTHKILAVDIPNTTTRYQTNPHLGVGARRSVSDHSDIGVRLELDRQDGDSLISVRALDYRYRFNSKFALSGFFGAGRYDNGLPAYGWYMGIGVQYMNLLPGWDLSLDRRRHEKLGRDKVLSDDPPSTPDRTREFFDVDGTTLYLSKRF